MNNKIDEIKAFLEAEIVPRYDAFDAGHRRDHVHSVMRESLRLATFYPQVEPSMVLVAAAYHDLGLAVGREVHHVVHHARVALVTSGTATLEAAILQTPQVACYRMNGSKWLYRFYRRLLHGNYVTLPNLIADEAIIPELLLHHCTSESIGKWLSNLLPSSPQRTAMLDGYHRVAERLTQKDCTDATARNIIAYLNEQQN